MRPHQCAVPAFLGLLTVSLARIEAAVVSERSWLESWAGQGGRRAATGLYAAEAAAGHPEFEEAEEEEVNGTACDTVADLSAGGAGVSGASGATHANGAFVMAAASPGAYVDGASITAALMDAAVAGVFACDAGYALDARATFECETTAGAATLSRQPCLSRNSSIFRALQTNSSTAEPEGEDADAAAEEEGGDCPDCVPTCTTEDVPPPGDLCPVGCAGCTAEGATARFYGVFGGLVAFTCLICFLKNHCGGGGDAPAAKMEDEGPSDSPASFLRSFSCAAF